MSSIGWALAIPGRRRGSSFCTTVTVKKTSRDDEHFKTLREQGAGKLVPKWLEMDLEALTGKVMALPARDDIDLTLEEHLIVEFYSR